MARERKRQEAASEQGLEELNLVEFPLGLLARERSKDIKTLVFRDSIFDKESGETIQRSVTVTGAAAWGLPNWFDQQVLLALIKLTNDKHEFKERELRFSLYELKRVLRLPLKGGSHNDTLKDSLKALLGMTVAYENAWRRSGKWKSLSAFHIIDNVALTNTKEDFDEDEEQHIKWNDVIVENIRALNAKKLDWDFFLSLKKPLTKRLYRFLDKRFGQVRRPWTFDLELLSHEKLGISRKTRIADCKKQLTVAISELEQRGFLARCDDPFERVRKGEWKVTFCPGRKQAGTELPKSEERPVPSPLEELLLSRGVTNAATLASKYPEELIREQVENFDDRNQQGDKLSPGWLRKAIEEGYGFRQGFVPKAEREAKQKAAAAKIAAREAAEAREQAELKAAEQRERKAFEAFLAALRSSGELQSFQEEALRENAFIASMYRKADDDGSAAMYLQTALESHWKKTTASAQ